MDAVDIPSETVPLEMKACEQILRRAKELKKPEPVVAYWCCFSAAQKALKVPNRSNEGTKWLMSLLDALEQMKALLASNEAVSNEAAGAAYIENFALKVFMSADNDDRKGATGKDTIRRFVVAGQFIEVLRCFENGMTEEMEQKLQYARWKAADGAKALREGRTPTSGPPIPEETEEDPFPTIPTDAPAAVSPPTSPPQARGSSPDSSRPTLPGSPGSSGTPTFPSPAHQPKVNLPSIDTAAAADSARTPHRAQSTGSGAWSTVATPGLPDDEDAESRFTPPNVQRATPSPPIERASPKGDKKNVRFTGPDGAPLSPAKTFVTVDSVDVPDAPPPTVAPSSPNKASPPRGTGRPRGDSNTTTGSKPVHPGNSPRATGDRPKSNSAAKKSPVVGDNSLPVPPPPPPSLASYPSAPLPSNGLGLTSPPPSAPLPSAFPSATQVPPPAQALGPTVTPNRKQIDQIQKHSRWAISALDYDDYETARSELRKALAILGG